MGRIMILGSAILGLTAACGHSPSWEDENRPATFWDSCKSDVDECANPFVCLEVEGLSGRVCTLECSETAECPRWEATGHCAGDFQSQCVNGFCGYGCE